MTFRHPLRNDWDEFKRRLEPLQLAPTEEGAMARAMLKIMPAFLDYIEDVRDRAEKPGDVLSAITAVLSNIAAQTIKQKVPGSTAGQREALRMMVQTIEREGKQRMVTRGIVMPGLILPRM